MRPSSSPSDGLFSPLVAHGAVASEVGATGWLRALLDVEAALARAAAVVGLVPQDAAQAIAAACADTSAFDPDELGRAAGLGGNPVIPLVRAIEQRSGAGGRWVHHGATSQDVLDTAMVLVARRAIAVLVADLTAVVETAAALAEQHRETLMSGRTLLQQAVATTFGLKCAGWALALDGAAQRLSAVALPVQLGGAAGTLAAYGGQGQRVVAALAEELGLTTSVLPWHTARLPVADLAGALGTTAGVVAKVALDLVLLAQTEVGEVTERVAGAGGSSAMPHKSNPIAAVQARACARRAPGLAATLLSCMEQEHERAAGGWHAEWVPLSDLFASTGAAVAWLRTSLAGLEVDAPRMLANLDLSSAATGAVSAALAERLGRARAHDVVAAAVARARERGVPLRDVLLAAEGVRDVLPASRLEALLASAPDSGDAARLVDAALAALRPDPRSQL